MLLSSVSTGQPTATFAASWRRAMPAVGPVVAALLFFFIGYLSAAASGEPRFLESSQISTQCLLEEVEQALQALDGIDDRAFPPSEAIQVQRADSALRRLRDYYLPLVEVRSTVYDALRSYYLGAREGALDDLRRAESALLAIGEAGGPQLSRELDRPLRSVVSALAAVRTRRGEAGRLLEQLGPDIDLLLARGSLILRGTELDAPGRAESR